MLRTTCQNIDFIDGGELQKVTKYPRYAKHVHKTANLALKPIRKHKRELKDYLHQPSFEYIAWSEDAGCYFCAAMWYGLREPPEYWNEAPIDDSTANSKSLPIALKLWISDNPQYTCARRDSRWVRTFVPSAVPIALICDEHEHRPIHFPRLSHDLEESWRNGKLLEADGHTGSDLSMDLARTLHKRCSRKHEACRLKHTLEVLFPRLPTRVIDVNAEGTNPVLHGPTEHERGEYVALSHCWGDTQPMPVKRNTLDEQASLNRRMRYFDLPPLAKWPKTFRDAVAVVRQFKLQYLWIDNTGIVQGDTDDWAKESERMAQYFGDATFTIAAAWGENDDQGLFHPRNPLLVWPLRLITASKRPPYPGFYICVDGPIHRYSMVESYHTPLYSRAWVLQEEQLSRRILRFGERCISWTCFCTWGASENNYTGRNVKGYKNNVLQDNSPMRVHLRLSDHGGTGRQQGRNPYIDMWYQIVHQFTNRNLKFKNDVLPAISGLAQTFVPFMDKDDEYLAGLWRKDLRLGLLWTADTIGFGRRLLPPYRPVLVLDF